MRPSAGRQFIRGLGKIVGRENVEHEPEDMSCYRFDGIARGEAPEAVVHPADAGEVARIVQLAAQAGRPLIPRGAGTGLSGGATTAAGGLIVNFDRMDRIRSISREDMAAVVEPGVINRDLKQAAAGENLFYPPDPSSTRVCTLGGNVAENAGGPYGTKYGVTGDFVLGLEAVTADGELLVTGGRNRRDVAGYDLTSLLVGSEGTLAVVTAITVRLLPQPAARQVALYVFDSVEAAGKTVAEMNLRSLQAAAVEIMDHITVRCVESYLPGSLPSGAQAVLLVELHGERESLEPQARRVEEACAVAGGRLARLAADEEEAERIWDARRAISPSLGRMAPTKIGEDISVPPSRVGEMIARIHEIAAGNDLEIAVFGHAGDGNLHPNILTDRRDGSRMARAETAVAGIFAAALELGGTLSGEHGIGSTKSTYMRDGVQDKALAVMRDIKRTLDPDGILNPGKIFPPGPA